MEAFESSAGEETTPIPEADQDGARHTAIAAALLDNWEAALTEYGAGAVDALDVVERAAHAVVNAKRAR